MRRKDRDCIMIAYKSDKFKLIDEKIIDYDDLAMKGQSLHAKHNKALVCLLHHTASDQLLVALTTQLYFHPALDYLKYAQCFYMSKQISRFILQWAVTYGREWKDFAIVIAGDFNSMPNQSAIGMIFNMEFDLPTEPNEPCELAIH